MNFLEGRAPRTAGVQFQLYIMYIRNDETEERSSKCVDRSVHIVVSPP
jgi:hypothetical protein